MTQFSFWVNYPFKHISSLMSGFLTGSTVLFWSGSVVSLRRPFANVHSWVLHVSFEGLWIPASLSSSSACCTSPIFPNCEAHQRTADSWGACLQKINLIQHSEAQNWDEKDVWNRETYKCNTGRILNGQ